MYWGAQVTGATGNIVNTTDLNDFTFPGTSCGAGSCIESGTLVPASTYFTFPGGADVNIGYGQTQVLSPGAYRNLFLNGSSTLILAPGVYTFSRNFDMSYDSEIIVDPPGTVSIFVDREIDIQSLARLNIANTDRYVFLYGTRNISLQSDADVHAVVYGRRDFTMQSGATVTGAVTTVDDITLNSGSTIIYDASAVANSEYDSFCMSAAVPAVLVAEWRMDELAWDGSANEVLDYSGNGLHGRAVNLDAIPSSQLANPAIAGDPGTCRSGDFNGISDGYVQIDDPGTNSILDFSTFSATAWVYARAWGAGGLASIISKDDNFEFHLNTTGQVNWWWGGGARELTTAAPLPLNEWHHLAITYEDGAQFIYIDGVVAASGTTATPGLTQNNVPVLIGTDLDFHSRRFNGLIDEVRLYDGPLTASEVGVVLAETHPCPVEVLLDHFVIDVGSGSASTCLPLDISITAEDSGNNTLSNYTGTVAITTSSNNGDWSNTGVASDALGVLTSGGGDSGDASYEFEQAALDDGSITLQLANSHAETISISVEDSSAGVSSGSATIVFSDNAYVVSSTDPLADDVVAGRAHSFQVEMIRNDPVTGSCGVASEYNVADVKVWMSRAGSDPGAPAPVLRNTDSSNTVSLPNSEPATVNFTLPFVSGVADFSLLSSDVGRYALNFLDNSSGFSDQDISGGSTTFVSRPFAFDIVVSANPGASGPAGDVFIPAADDFSATVRAVAWDTADDRNGDGIADGHNDFDPSNNANLSNNTVVSGFGQELPPESVQLSEALIEPVGGNDPGLGTRLIAPADGRQLSLFTGGVATTSSLYFGEVGIIELAAMLLDGDYLGAGNVFSDRVQGRSGYVGRFTPKHFVLTPSALNPACGIGSFSYMEEPFNLRYSIDARNALNQLTQNYTGAYSKFDPSGGLGIADAGAIDAILPTLLSSRLSHTTAVTWSNGVGAANMDATLARAGSPDGPYTQVDIGVAISDSDGISLRPSDLDLDSDNNTVMDSVNLGQTSSYFGRLRLADAFGPETADLPVIFTTEYWNGATWLQNTSDDCTQIAASAILYPDGTIDISANRVVAVGGGTSAGVYGNFSAGTVNFSGGDAGHYFTAPGATNLGTFEVNIDLSFYPWLRYDWNGDGSFDDLSMPAASYSFGSYRGHDRIIYWQEVLR